MRMRILLILTLAASAAVSGCTVYRNMPERGEPSPEMRRYADSLSAVREQELAEILTHDRGQQRAHLTWNPVLAQVARQRARDMAVRGYFAHVTPEGIGTNTLVERAGYHLPSTYDHSLAGNNIESAAEGYASAAAAWRHWMGSPHHRAHLLGLAPEFRTQTEFGIGYVLRPGSKFGSYWVVLIARPATADSAAATER